jgi:hypothetical protein
LILIDNLNILVNGCYTSIPALEFVEILNELLGISERDPCVTLAIGVNRDLIDEEMTREFYREYKNSVFDFVFEVNRNISGYTKDVHGQLNIISKKR